jgi:hypothetical protein
MQGFCSRHKSRRLTKLLARRVYKRSKSEAKEKGNRNLDEGAEEEKWGMWYLGRAC